MEKQKKDEVQTTKICEGSVGNDNKPTTENETNDSNNESFLTRSRAFKSLVKWAFNICDTDKSGTIDKAELYTGVLLVHLKIAKYAGGAACFPASRETVDKLFDASDVDNSNSIDLEEFEKIMVVCCGQIVSRILIYLALLLLVSPCFGRIMVVYLQSLLEDKAWAKSLFHLIQAPIAQFPWLDAMFDWDTLAEDIFGMAFFVAVFPIVFGAIDSFYQSAAEGEMLKSFEARKKND